MANLGELGYELVVHEAAISVDHDMPERHLRKALIEAIRKWISDMELRGHIWDRRFPVVMLTDKEGKLLVSPTPQFDSSGELTMRPVPKTLEESGGKVDYRFRTVFRSPQVVYERLVSKDAIRERERQAKNPTLFTIERSIKDIGRSSKNGE